VSNAIRDALRRKVNAIWQSEPSVGVALTPAQKHAWRKTEVKRVVDPELEGRLKLGQAGRSERPEGASRASREVDR
jgi:hypothetical protein